MYKRISEQEKEFLHRLAKLSSLINFGCNKKEYTYDDLQISYSSNVHFEKERKEVSHIITIKNQYRTLELEVEYSSRKDLSSIHLEKIYKDIFTYTRKIIMSDIDEKKLPVALNPTDVTILHETINDRKGNLFAHEEDILSESILNSEQFEMCDGIEGDITNFCDLVIDGYKYSFHIVEDKITLIKIDENDSDVDHEQDLTDEKSTSFKSYKNYNLIQATKKNFDYDEISSIYDNLDENSKQYIQKITSIARVYVNCLRLFKSENNCFINDNDISNIIGIIVEDQLKTERKKQNIIDSIKETNSESILDEIENIIPFEKIKKNKNNNK